MTSVSDLLSGATLGKNVFGNNLGKTNPESKYMIESHRAYR